jgi:2-amino-4-hydroxy-6-hydroxymethyldihydropteridine diphosphokinase
MTQVTIALGSNMGDRIGYLRQAVEDLSSFVQLKWKSRVYETEPMYVVDQPAFLNAAILAETDLGPLPLLKRLKDAEAKIGRMERVRNGPREIDLDLIGYGAIIYRFGSRLEIPHPRVAERGFVLRPLADLNPRMELPGLGVVENLLAQTSEPVPRVVEWGNAELPV